MCGPPDKPHIMLALKLGAGGLLRRLHTFCYLHLIVTGAVNALAFRSIMAISENPFITQA